MFELTGCDAVMIGRGAVHNPWLFQQAKMYMHTGVLPPEPSLAEKIDLLKLHLQYSVAYKGENRGVVEMRKHYSGYLKGLPNIAKVRSELMTYTTLDTVLQKLNEIVLMYERKPADIEGDRITEGYPVP
jgi:tRNA-dihydrouridine synthase